MWGRFPSQTRKCYARWSVEMTRYVIITTKTRLSDCKEYSGSKIHNDGTLKWLQDHCGGSIESFPLHDGATLFLNEEGRVAGLPPNDAAIGYLQRENLCTERALLGLMSFTGTIHGTVVVQLSAKRAAVVEPAGVVKKKKRAPRKATCYACKNAGPRARFENAWGICWMYCRACFANEIEATKKMFGAAWIPDGNFKRFQRLQANE